MLHLSIHCFLVPLTFICVLLVFTRADLSFLRPTSAQMAFKASPAFNPLTTEARELQKWLQDGILRSVDLVDIYLSQISKYDGYLHAMISTVPREQLMERARKLDSERSASKTRSPLHGIPVIVKDNIATHPSLGVKTTSGNLALANSCVKRNAKVVDALLAAGAIILGKANLSEMSNYKGINITSGWSAIRGQTQSAYVRGDVNPDDGKDGHSNPSGSSSGSAVAVSAGFAPFSIGTETDGSICVPAGRAALYTIKPTIGLVPTMGIIPVSHNMDSAGPMAKSSYDLALLLDHMIDRDAHNIHESFTTAVTGSWAGVAIATLDPDQWDFPEKFLRPVPEATAQMRREFEAAYVKLRTVVKNYVHHIHLVDMDQLNLNGKNSETVILNADFAKDIETYLQDLETSPVRTLKELIEFNELHADKELPPEAPNQDHLLESYEQETSPEDYEIHFKHFRHVAKDLALDRAFSEHKVNVIIAPIDSSFTSLAAGSGYPIATLPLGYLKYNGRPFGLSAIAASHQERLLVQVQSAWEATFEKRQPPVALEHKVLPKV